jgi:immunity protein 8 of polymorphic toxin system
MMVGPADSEGEESFDVLVCTTKWLEDRYGREDLVVLRHHVLVHHFDYDGLYDGLRKRVNGCTGDTWQQIAQQVGRIGKWEFEDYT